MFIDEKDPLESRVNTAYWYGEEDINLILCCLIKRANLMLGVNNQRQGLLLKEDGTLFSSNEFSYTLGYDLASTVAFTTAAQGDLLKSAFKYLLDWNAKELKNENLHNLITTHRVIIPLDVQGYHWNTLEIALKIERDGEKFTINKDVVANIYESLSGVGIRQISTVHKFIQSLMNELQLGEHEYEFTGKVLNCKQQPDTKACGPITVRNIWSLVENGQVDLDISQKYTVGEIKALRLAHIQVVNNETFTQKQSDNTTTKTSSAVINGDPTSISAKLNDYINERLSVAQQEELNSALQEFSNASKEYDKLTDVESVSVSEEKYAAAFKAYTSSATSLKAWFLSHYRELEALGLVQSIFKPINLDNPPDELSWCDNGLDTLLSVVPKFISVHAYSAFKSKYISKQNIDEQKMSKDDCFIRGTSMSGVDLCLMFVGKKDQSDKIISGNITCFVGDRMNKYSGVRIVYNGPIENGLMVSSGSLLILDADLSFKAYVKGEFKDGVLDKVIDTNIADPDFLIQISKHISEFKQDFRFNTKDEDIDNGAKLLANLRSSKEEKSSNASYYSRVTEIGLSTYFEGQIDELKKPMHGRICSLIGDILPHGFYLAYEGRIREGIISGQGTLTLHKPGYDELYTINVYTKIGFEVAVLSSDLPSEIEEEIFAEINQHLLANKTNFKLNLEDDHESKIRILGNSGPGWI